MTHGMTPQVEGTSDMVGDVSRETWLVRWIVRYKLTDTQRTLVGDVRRSTQTVGGTARGQRQGTTTGHWSRPGEDPTHGVGENVRTRRRQVGGGPTLDRA